MPNTNNSRRSEDRRRGDDPFVLDGEPTTTSIGDFWSWASSDLMDNSLRGRLAEFIVGTALDCVGCDRIRVEWDAVDLETDDGIRIEVKSTAHLQSWGASKPGSLRFSIRESHAWDAKTNTYVDGRRRTAHVYVFCVHTATEPAVADPLILDQWEFHVVPVNTLNDVFGGQRTVALTVLRDRTGAPTLTYAELASAVRTAAGALQK